MVPGKFLSLQGSPLLLTRESLLVIASPGPFSGSGVCWLAEVWLRMLAIPAFLWSRLIEVGWIFRNPPFPLYCLLWKRTLFPDAQICPFLPSSPPYSPENPPRFCSDPVVCGGIPLFGETLFPLGISVAANFGHPSSAVSPLRKF